MLEFLTAFVLDTFFHFPLWSYSTWPLNFRGYICLPVTVIWGIMSLFVVYVSQPPTDRLIKLILSRKAASAAVLCVFACVAAEYVMRVIELFIA